MRFCKLFVYDVSSMVYAGTLSKFGSDYVDGKLEGNNLICGLAVGGVRRILNDALLNLRQGDAVLFAFDSKNNKSELYPEYKSDRTRNDMVKVQCQMLIEICDRIGIPYVKQEGFEADDLVANVMRQQINEFSSFVIITGDQDLAANIISPKVTIKGSAAIYPSINVRNYQAVLSKDTQVPYNAILPYLYFYGKSSNSVKPLKVKIPHQELYKKFLSFAEIAEQSTWSTNGMMAKFILQIYKEELIKDDDALIMSNRIGFVYPTLIHEPVEFKVVLREDINKEELKFFCRALKLMRIANMYGFESLEFDTPFSKLMQAFMLRYKDMLDTGRIASAEQITPDISYFVNRTTTFTENIGEF